MFGSKIPGTGLMSRVGGSRVISHQRISTESTFFRAILSRMAILADLVSKFSVGPENIATEALNLILKNSTPTRKAFIRFCLQSGAELPEDLSFRTQVSSEEHGRPDLVGSGDKGNILIIEAKFDAGFTENQPVAYFEHFAVSGLLLFIVPEYRRQAAWLQLCQRCQHGGIAVHSVSSTAWSLLAQVGIHRMALVSWRSVLRFLLDSAHDLGDGDKDAIEDLNQLSTLCERMDEDAFSPFRAEELTDAGIARRFAQLMSLPGKVVTTAAGRGICEAGRPAVSESYCGRYLRIGRYTLYLGIFFDLWKRHTVSPIWIQTGVGADWPQNTVLPAADKDRLRSSLFSVSIDPSVFPIEVNGSLLLPLVVKVGLDRDEVLNHAAQQILDLRNALVAGESEV
jgi:hypothetical protein